MTIPDFANLPITALATYLVLIAAADTLAAIVLSVVHGNFSATYVADYLRTHVLLRVFPIAALGILGHGIKSLGVPEIPAVSLFATGGLAAYLVETIGSIRDSFTSTNPAPTPPTPTPEG